MSHAARAGKILFFSSAMIFVLFPILLIQLASAAEECGVDYSSRRLINEAPLINRNIISGRSLINHFGNITIPIAVYTDKYFDARFKSDESRRKTIVAIFKTASMAYQFDANMNRVANIKFRIVHVATSKTDTIGEVTEKGKGDKISDLFEHEQLADRNKAGRRWEIAVLLVGVNAWLPRKENEKKRPTIVTGLATRGEFCFNQTQSACWVEAKNMNAGLVAAHEIGHV